MENPGKRPRHHQHLQRPLGDKEDSELQDNENPVWVPGRLTRNIKTEDQEDDNSGDPHADPGSANKSAERTTVGNNVNLPPPDAGDV